ncbi:DUF4136 domain-containing protein [Teredinibacter waterburyi]|uniref:DUF4136 domain-containing protein n=1 Tax=Teredinibacter waterburyi TaxID=1500538 RepID=UPI00165F4DCC|nr:DUF4136 domain-containing protein [Teredinibacter waterburyi]
MGNSLASISLALLVSFLVGCASPPKGIDYRSDYAFESLKSFTILPVDEKTFQDPRVSKLEVARIGSILNKQLQQRYTAVESNNLETSADFKVRFYLVVDERMRVESYDTMFGLHWAGPVYRVGINTPDIHNTYYQQGTIIVDMLDGATNEVFWRGTVGGKISDTATPQKRDQRAEKLIKRLLEGFPPNRQ